MKRKQTVIHPDSLLGSPLPLAFVRYSQKRLWRDKSWRIEHQKPVYLVITWLDEPAVHQHLWTCIIQISTSNAGEVKLHWITTVNSEETCKTGKSNFSPSLSAQCLASSITIFPLLLVFWLPRVALGIGMWMEIDMQGFVKSTDVTVGEQMEPQQRRMRWKRGRTVRLQVLQKTACYMYTYGWAPLLPTGNYHNIVNRLFSSIKPKVEQIRGTRFRKPSDVLNPFLKIILF